MSDDNTIDYQNSKRGLAYAMEEALAERRRAIIDGDRTASAEAVLKINRLHVEDQNLDRLYVSAQRQQAPQHHQASRPVRFRDEYGVDRVMHMTDEQRELAHGIGGTVRGLTNEMREAEYAKQAAKHARMVADGSYSDGQGRQRAKFG